METDAGTSEGRYLCTAVAVVSIWLAVGLAAIFAPDLVTGSQQEHIPIAAFGDWLWGGIATALVLLAASRRVGGAMRPLWAGMAVAVGGIWLVVLLASVFSPQIVTGTDPTRIPIGAIVSPVAGAIATAFVSVFVAGSAGREQKMGGAHRS